MDIFQTHPWNASMDVFQDLLQLLSSRSTWYLHSSKVKVTDQIFQKRTSCRGV